MAYIAIRTDSLLVRETKDTYLSYFKSHLNQVYLQINQRKSIIHTLPDSLQKCFAEDDNHN